MNIYELWPNYVSQVLQPTCLLEIQLSCRRGYYRRLSTCQLNQYNYKYWDGSAVYKDGRSSGNIFPSEWLPLTNLINTSSAKFALTKGNVRTKFIFNHFVLLNHNHWGHHLVQEMSLPSLASTRPSLSSFSLFSHQSPQLRTTLFDCAHSLFSDSIWHWFRLSAHLPHLATWWPQPSPPAAQELTAPSSEKGWGDSILEHYSCRRYHDQVTKSKSDL